MSHVLNQANKSLGKASGKLPQQQTANALGLGGVSHKLVALTDPSATAALGVGMNYTNKKNLSAFDKASGADLQAPDPVTQDTATSSAFEMQDLFRRRRGVLANIFAGNSAASPTVSTKSLLGG